jgi:acetyl-CoA carboxylase biotin carboxyl carrier protein
MEIKEIRELMVAFDESSLSEFRYKNGEEQLVLRRGGSAASVNDAGDPVVSPTVAPAGGAPASSAVAEAENAILEPGPGDTEHVVSPIVGTFYRSPSPDAPPFVEEGTEVAAGGPLCILEAMKVMNELQAEFDLEVVTILVENGQMVEYGTPLLEVRRK